MEKLFYFALGGIGGLAIAAIGAWLQHRSWVHQNFENRREEQKKAASAVVSELAQLLDRRLYRQRRFLWALRSGSATDIQEALADYQKILCDYNDNFGRVKAALWTYFGRDAMMQFETSLHERFVTTGQALEGIHAGRLPKKPTLGNAEKSLRVLGYDNYQFLFFRLKEIKRDQVGDLEMFSHVSQENWSRLTSSFLLRRLFGLAQHR